ncbi:MAG: hypothetical protein Ct9H300mP8_03610 [Gammaproteobacteria bacterium]|nr:MAG: hypothetical protein Ct9H300mP8_03610 [Gammaproteobacteria bacterium]
MSRAEPNATQSFNTLVNTHANGDHCNGNELVHGAEIISSVATAAELAEESPDRPATMMRAHPTWGSRRIPTALFRRIRLRRHHADTTDTNL